MKKRAQTGFTLYELLITLAIVGIVLVFGIPNLTQFTRNSRITSTANDLHAAFQLARTEAARAKTNITICASANSMAAAADCGGTWEQGFIVFVDTDFDKVRDAPAETVLRRQPRAPDGVSLAIADDADYFMYASTGLGRRDAGDSTPLSRVIVCDQRGTVETSKDFSAARLFVATPLGRATVVRDYTTVDAALTAMGKACP
ncbi:MAG: GspH/FimT family pseudopilin [Gammaproteobacteria bacterium]|nr:GspH/FimT family pseudopilin [Gammaproteobacteria bacterium]